MKSKYEEARRDLSRDVDFVDDNYPISDNKEWVGIRGKKDKWQRDEEESIKMKDVEDEKKPLWWWYKEFR